MKIEDQRYMQYVAALAAALSVVTSATYLSWSSPVIPKIAAGETPLGLNVTTEERSWIVSSVILGMIPGSLLSGWMVERFGRRKSMLIAAVPLLLPWLAITFIPYVLAVCIARFIAGVAIAVAVSGCVLYNGEIAEKDIRGTLGATFNVAEIIGELFMYGVGPVASFLALNLSSCTIPVIFFICFYFMPESPYYLSKIGKNDKAKKHLKTLLRTNTSAADLDKYLSKIKNTVDEEMENDATLWEFLTKPDYRKLLIISLTLQCILQLTGAVVIISYLQPILARSNSSLAPGLASLLCGVIQLVAERSWIVSSVILGMIPGSLLSGWMVERFGRRKSMLIAAVPLLLPWLAITFIPYVLAVCIARFIAGVAIAVAVSGCVLYNGEIAEKDIRGTLGATFNVAEIIGELFMYGVGPVASFLALNLSSCTIPVIFFICFYFMPESPYYLSKIGKNDKAKKHLKTLLRTNTSAADLDKYLSKIKNTVDEEMENDATLWEFLTKPDYRKLLVISLTLQCILQLTGAVVIISYLQPILARSNSSLAPGLASLLCGVIQLVAVCAAAVLVDRAGRKPLLIISSMGCALALSSEAVFFYLQDVAQLDLSHVSWIPLAGILCYLVMRPMGLGTLPYVLMGELFSTNIKGHAIAVSTFFNYILGFAITKAFEPLSAAGYIYVMFLIFALVSVFSAFFTYFVIPETKNKTFAEIRMLLNAKSSRGKRQAVFDPL